MKWYKRDPDAALTGMRGLTHEEKSAYNTIIDLTYSRNGNLPDDEHVLCIHIECRPQWWRRIRASLIAKEKIRIVDGKIVANRVLRILAYFHETPPKLSRNSPETPPKLATIREVSSEKPNNINDRELLYRTRTRTKKKIEGARAHAREKTFAEYDYLSSDEAVHFTAIEIGEMEQDFAGLKDVRAMLRQTDRFLSALPDAPPRERRKAVVIASLRKKNLEALDRQQALADKLAADEARKDATDSPTEKWRKSMMP